LLAPGVSYVLRDHPRARARSFCQAIAKDGSNIIRHGGGGGADDDHLGIAEL
jgi:hypothetical protein